MTLSKIVISGASGFVGQELVAFLRRRGIEVIPLSRKGGPFYWNPAKGELNPKLLEGAQAIINLSGENIGTGIWTKKKKKKILQSRIQTAELIRKTMNQMENPPHVLISASSIGYYGHTVQEWLDEDSPSGESFLSEVCKQWEEAVLPIESHPVRIVILRFGIVMSPKGGLLKRMLLPFKLGLGGVLGSGEQWISWIGLEELCEIFAFILANETLLGPVNVVTHTPITNRELVTLLGKHLRRPTLFSIPAFLLKALPGGMGEDLFLRSIKVYPKKLLKAGYTFKTISLPDILST